MDLMTVEQAARHLQVTPETVRRHARQGLLDAVKIGKLWRIRITDGCIGKKVAETRNPKTSPSAAAMCLLKSMGV